MNNLKTDAITLEATVKKLLEDNKPNLGDQDSYGRGYAEGYHDALIDVLSQHGIKTDEPYFN